LWIKLPNIFGLFMKREIKPEQAKAIYVPKGFGSGQLTGGKLHRSHGTTVSLVWVHDEI